MNANRTRPRRSAIARPAVLLTTVALGLLGAQLRGAEQSGGPQSLGHQSQGQESQRGPVSVPNTGARMPGQPGKPIPPQEVLIGGKTVRMADALKAPPKVTAGEQPSLAAAKGLKPSGGGGQKDPKAEAAPTEKHLHLVLRLTEDGDSEVVSATEVPGPAALTEEPVGDFIYEVSEDSQTLAAQALDDPFETRSFSASPDQGHSFSRSKVATVVVQVPQRTLESPLERLNIRLLRVKPGEPLERINAEELRKLRQANRLQTVVSVPAAKLAPQIRQRGRKAPAQ